jgi:hypothetical protein
MGWQIKFLLVNGAFSVRKCIVKPKEKIIVASYGKTSGFSAVGAEELMLVNGGKGGGGGGGGSSSPTVGYITDARAADALNGKNASSGGTTNPVVGKVVTTTLAVAATFIPGIGGIIATALLGDAPLH